jgi:hypothetical protein
MSIFNCIKETISFIFLIVFTAVFSDIPALSLFFVCFYPVFSDLVYNQVETADFFDFYSVTSFF